MSGPLLYCNPTQTVVLIDLPASIEHGQHSSRSLKSCPASDEPYASTEPKGSKRDAVIQAMPLGERVYHTSVQEQISSALNDVRGYLQTTGGSWCLGRHYASSQHDIMGLTALGTLSAGVTSAPVPVVLSTTERRSEFPSLQSLVDCVVHNPRNSATLVDTRDHGEFIVPSGSTFIQATLESGFPSFGACLALLPTSFDLILMDPPWSNRSVRHSAAYRTSEDQTSDAFLQAVSVVQAGLAPRGVVAIWITNKASIRAHVLRTMQSRGLHLHQEWVWIKVTARGVPVTPLDGVWRRPYEVLLLFREGPSGQAVPPRRVMVAVPDLHSRKPCLKSLLEGLLPAKYHALELFARSLTAGWWSWGDEVLKFQHESQWMDDGI
jgi:N6-adenosine-specific RNA methylase IME4